MHFSAWISLLLNSTAATAIVVVLPRVPPQSRKESLSWWLGLLGVGLIFLSLRKVFSLEVSGQESLQALLVGASVIAGIALKWTLAIWASRGESLHERSLVNALFLSPLSLLCAHVFPPTGLLALALWGFISGFFWQAICDDGAKIFSKQ
jgi:hypothetical protein